MSFKYNPNPVSNKKVIPEGVYDATIYGVTETKQDGTPLVSSKSGEPMQKVTFEVYSQDRNAYVNQFFTAESMAYFYKKLAIALGQVDAFTAGTFDAGNFIGTSVKLQIIIKPDDSGNDQNNIKAFLPAKSASPATASFPRQATAPKPAAVPTDSREMDPKDLPF